ncbi:hypothetical protein RJ639_035368 [Escallonia herrerae]|uniref:Protein kinase domain-containing protein n=1 Tax=Escallonia herrerae TaxID=1293975 RepID=A0AA88WNV0_9ASTE|nr:hypothetical protein RJ639_035368 [Escallonia herrerae]
MSNNKDGILAQELPSGGQTLTPSFKQFTFSELKSITKNFNKERILRMEPHVVAYIGWIDEKTYTPSEVGVGMAVVVKEITLNGFQDSGLRQILEFMRNCSHPYLVKLLGYCTESDKFGVNQKFLVHEYMQKGSLDNHLFRKGAEPLSWPIRVKIAIGAAQGLAFLHTVEKQNMYSKFEATNILLDKDFNAKLSDFGMQELYGAGDPSSYDPLYYVPGAGPKFISKWEGGRLDTTTNVGISYKVTLHLAGDFRAGLLSRKVDVYDFGIVLLQILVCRRDVGEFWARTYYSTPEKVKSDLMGMELQQRIPLRAARRVAVLVLQCLSTEPSLRPSMEDVLLNLETIEKETST